MEVYLATDHAGFELKEALIPYIESLGHTVIDCGAVSLEEGDDYPDFVHKAAEAVAEAPRERVAIVLGGSGQGEAMVANRHQGVRAIVYYGEAADIIKLGREHNDANVLSLGARFVSEAEAKAAVELFLNTAFSGEERHVRRIGKID